MTTPARLIWFTTLMLLAGLCPAQAPSVVTLTFEGLQDNEPILNYYNGGFGGFGSGPGPNYGITFGTDSLAIVSQATGGTGNFSGNPSGSTVAFFLSGAGVVMSAPAGFQNGFAFYYSAPYDAGTVTVYDGVGATGNVLATISLGTTGAFCNGSTYDYSCWQQAGVTFNGTAKSASFGGSANFIGFDNITVGTGVATPPLRITTASLPSGTANTAYNAPLSAAGGTAPYTWSATGLPPGLQVTNGAVTGTPATAGTYSVSLTVRDSTSPALTATTQQPLTLIINPAPPPSITTTSLPGGTVNVSYSAQLAATGGKPGYTWSASGLPAPLTMNTSGLISGTPTAAGTFTVSVTVKDSASPQASATSSFTLVISGLTLTLSTTSLPNGTVGAAYSAPVAATGGVTPYTWAASGLPSGLSMNTSGVISGTPTAAGTFTVSVTVKDSASPQGSATRSLTLVIAAPALTISTGSLPNATAGMAYNATLSATGGTPTYTWTAGGLPAGLNMSISGVVSGTPTASGNSTVTVTVRDNSSPQATATKTFTLVVAAQLQITCSPASGPVLAGASFTITCTASGGTPGYTFSLSSGALPQGLTTASGPITFTISGNPTATGSYSFTVQVKDSAGQSAVQSFTGTISPAPAVSTFSLNTVPSTANQYTANLSLSTAPPVALAGTLCLTFTPDAKVVGGSSYQSQEVLFANGGTSQGCSSTLKTTLNFTIPTTSATASWSGGSSQFSQGTVAGTIKVTMMSLVDANGNSALPSTAPAQTITVASALPALTNTPQLTTTSSTVTVVFDAVTPTRGVTGVTYTFNPGSGQVTFQIPFNSGTYNGFDQQWFATAASLPTGGAFSLSATLSCANCSALTAVQVTN